MSATRKSRTFTPEHLARISAALRGRPQSPEHRAKRLAAVAAAKAARLATLAPNALSPQSKNQEKRT